MLRKKEPELVPRPIQNFGKSRELVWFGLEEGRTKDDIGAYPGAQPVHPAFLP